MSNLTNKETGAAKITISELVKNRNRPASNSGANFFVEKSAFLQKNLMLNPCGESGQLIALFNFA